MKPRAVCWQNREEWLYVYRALYNFDDPEAQRRGLDRVAAWKSRSAGKLPIAIESTAVLISAQLALEDVTYNLQMKLTVAMAIVRFVNGMVDQFQTGKYARTVHSIAEEIGLPDWLVDLRHEATHANLPSMELLQRGLCIALSWLKMEYWEAQMKVHDGNDRKLFQLLNKYWRIAVGSVTGRKKKADPKLKDISKELVYTVSTSNQWSLLPSILFSEGILLPSQDKLSSLAVRWSHQDNSMHSLVDDVPIEIIEMWEPLLKALDESSEEFTTSLIMYLLQHLSDSQTGGINKPSCYFAWIKILLGGFSRDKFPLVLNKGIEWVVVLQATLENPTSYSLALIPIILKNIPAISASLKDKIEYLVSVFLNTEHGSSSCMEECQYFDLVEAITKKINESEQLLADKWQDQISSANLEWKVSQGATQWHLIPIGEVLGVSNLTPTCLELSRRRENPILQESNAEYTAENSLANSDPMAVECHDDQSLDGDQPGESIQDYESDPMLEEDQIDKTHETENDISYISNHICLF